MKIMIKHVATYSIICAIFISTNAFALMCPSNFNFIAVGDSIDKVIRLCGAPDERNESQEDVTIAAGTNVDKVNGNANQVQNKSPALMPGSTAEVNNVRERKATTTKLIYQHTQPTVLIFKDGHLVDRVSLQ